MRGAIPIVVVNPSGVPVDGASALVYHRGTGDLAAVYQADNGSTSYPSPQHTDLHGRLSGWLERGAYDVYISGPGLDPYTVFLEIAPASDGTIDTLWIADDALTAAKIGALAVATEHLQDQAVTAAKIAAGAIAASLGLPNDATRFLRGDGTWPTIESISQWRPAVTLVADLPTDGNTHGDTRLVLEDFTIHAWDGITLAWVSVSGSGGSGGGVTPQTLFIQETEPDPAGLVRDSLYIPVNPDGTPKAISQWKVYTGTGSGNGGNLFVQELTPSPAINALWVPLNPDGKAKYLDQWVVFTGHPPSVAGNPNLKIGPGATHPGTPEPGTLFIPLNVDGSPKPLDLWEVYA